MALLKILGLLAIALLILIPLLERYGKPAAEQDPEKLRRMQHWILPMVALLALLQLLRHWFG